MDGQNTSDVSQQSAPGAVEAPDQGNLQQPVAGEPQGQPEVDNSFKARADRARLAIDNSENQQAESDEANPAEPKEAAEQQQPEPPPEKPDRVSKFKQLETQAQEATAKFDQVNSQLEKYGGVEGFEAISNVFGAFLDPNGKFTVSEADANGGAVEREVSGKEMIRDFVNQLPESGEIFSDFFLQGLDNEQNRVFAVNDVMKQEFGLRPDADITQDQLNTVFELLAAKLNLAKSPEEVNKVFKDFEYETKGLDYNADEFTKDRKIQELEARLAEKNNPQADTKTADPVQEFQKSYDTALQEEQKRFESEDGLLLDRYEKVGREFIGKYGLQPDEKDFPELKEAKQLLNDLILGKTNIAQQIRYSAAFKNAAKFLHKGGLDKPLGNIASSNLNTAMKSAVEGVLSKLAPLIGGKNGATRTAPATVEKDKKAVSGIEANRHPVEEKLDFKAKARQVRGTDTPDFTNR